MMAGPIGSRELVVASGQDGVVRQRPHHSDASRMDEKQQDVRRLASTGVLADSDDASVASGALLSISSTVLAFDIMGLENSNAADAADTVSASDERPVHMFGQGYDDIAPLVDGMQ